MAKARNGLKMGLDQERAARQHDHDELMKVRADLASAYADLARAKEETSLVTSQMADLRREILSLREEIRARDVSITAQDAEIARFKGEIETYDSLLGQSDTGPLVAERDALKTQLANAESRAQALQIQARDANQKLANAEARFAQYKDRTVAAEDKARKATDDLKAAQAKIQATSDELTKYKTRLLTIAAEDRKAYDDLIARYSKLSLAYNSIADELKTTLDLADRAGTAVVELRKVLAEKDESIKALDLSLRDADARAETAIKDAERAERARETAASLADKANEELARLRRSINGRFKFADFEGLFVNTDRSHFDFAVRYCSDRTILIERIETVEISLPEPSAVKSNGSAKAEPIQLPPPSTPMRTCSWCDHAFPATPEYFEENTVHGIKNLGAWCKDCHGLRNRILGRLDAKFPNWDGITELLTQALAICPNLAEREPFIGYFLDPNHRVGVEPKTRYLFETQRTQIPFPKVHHPTMGRQAIDTSA